MPRKLLLLMLCALLVLAASGAAGAADFLKKETPHFVIHYKPVGITANIDERAAEIEDYYQRLLNVVGAKPGRKITIKWYPTLEEFQKAEASEYAGNVDQYQKEIQSGGEPSMVIYGVTFLAAHAVGSSSRFICDGLAIAFFQEHQGKPWYWEFPLMDYVKGGLDEWIELERISRDLFYFNDKPIARPEAGIFLRYLVETYGVEKFRKFIKNLQDDSSLNARTKSVYGKTLVQLETELKEWILNQPVNEDDPPYVPLFETSGLQYRKQRFVFDEYEVTPILEADAAQAQQLLTSLKADLGLAPSGRIQWLVTHPNTLRYVKGLESGYVDEAGVVRAAFYFEPHLLALAAARVSGKAPEILRWGVALVWGKPAEGKLRFGSRTIAEWGRHLADSQEYVPLEKLLTAFPEAPTDEDCAQAGVLVQYLVDTYGKERFGGFFRAVDQGQPVVPALENLAGKPLSEIEKELLAALRTAR